MDPCAEYFYRFINKVSIFRVLYRHSYSPERRTNLAKRISIGPSKKTVSSCLRGSYCRQRRLTTEAQRHGLFIGLEPRKDHQINILPLPVHLTLTQCSFVNKLEFLNDSYRIYISSFNFCLYSV